MQEKIQSFFPISKSASESFKATSWEVSLCFVLNGGVTIYMYESIFTYVYMLNVAPHLCPHSCLHFLLRCSACNQLAAQSLVSPLTVSQINKQQTWGSILLMGVCNWLQGTWICCRHDPGISLQAQCDGHCTVCVLNLMFQFFFFPLN